MQTNYKYIIILLCLNTLPSRSEDESISIFGLQSENRVEDDFIFVFKQPCKDAQEAVKTLSEHLQSYSVKFETKQVYHFGDFSAVRINIATTHVETACKHNIIKFAETNQRFRLQLTTNQGQCTLQKTGEQLWGLSRISSRDKPSYGSAKYNFLPHDGFGVDVYVADTGIYFEHEEFGGRAIPGFVASSMQEEGLEDRQGHGTHVSGTIGGTTYGLAKQARLISVKVLNKDGVGTTGDLLEGLEWIYQNFTGNKERRGNQTKAVINMSLGGMAGRVQTLDEALIGSAVKAGIPVVAAAGNNDADACGISPARLPDVVAVGATNINDDFSIYSNYGSCVDILAPGDAILSAYIGSPSASAIMSGTSMATPHVTGVVARLLSQLCAATSPSSIRTWLQQTATKNDISLIGTAKLSTTNLLLYMGCIAEDIGNMDATGCIHITDFDLDHEDDQRMLILFIVALAVLLTFIVLAVTCCILCKVNNIQRITKSQLQQQQQQQQSMLAQRPAATNYNTFQHSYQEGSGRPPPYATAPEAAKAYA